MISKARIAITLGDPTGIGPEVVAKALSSESISQLATPIIIGSVDVLNREFERLQSSLQAKLIESADQSLPNGKIGVISPIDNPHLVHLPFGEISNEAGEAAVSWARTAGKLALSGKVDAIATAPISKEAARLAGYEDFGHQEIYQHLAGVARVLTMLITTNLRVVHLTTHHSLARSVDYVHKQGITEAIGMVDLFLKSYGFTSPRIGVAALNPHGGEGGLIGSEEIDEISPAIQASVKNGIQAFGPIPADTVFGQAVEGQYEAVLAMYHDQGHIAVKMHNWAESLTLNIGLPFLRTSVDHGTAFNIAGKGIADPTGMIEAINYAAEVASTSILPGAK